MRSAVQKLLHPLCGWPIIAWPVSAAREAGAARIVVVDSPERRLEAALGGCDADQAHGARDGDDGRGARNGDVSLAVQARPLGTADAVRAAIPEVGSAETIIVINGDAPLISADTIMALAKQHERTGAAATIATMVLEDPAGYGRVVRAPDGTVERVAETKAPGDASQHELHIREVNTGMFAFDRVALTAALAEVRPQNAQQELYLPDVVPILREHERTVQAHEIADSRELAQINDRRQLADVTAVAQRLIHERHMLAGVTIVQPDATVIDVQVSIGQDAVIGPFTSLCGATTVGTGSTIGPGCTLIDTWVGSEARVVHAYTNGAVVGDRVSVGPFAHLRPGTVLREGAKAGSFVEIKNSDVGAGSKVPHLSYVGDTDIGEGANLGASTITANYDGYRKNRTRIGDRVKTSVDTTLVAPVTVGDDAFTAAGSVIGSDVPAGALAGSPGVARSQQRNVEGYAERRRNRERAVSDGASGEQR
jgi:bifunctional UDP-N-acetylglucosamine pyrophosphorylase/glucosamine-1-phosphate N-acetyltransferase